ncbi:hypothetical protein [Breoghania sp.]|uniref:hypothetical protein n=1 Tax=Breoghania sp. TaxID=2065378 RepID=UPI0026039A1F|nr:hypothetical protein [Breoghania sp.]MDJ0931082.1 hypothetical protein [Breoghania sp.]
MSETNLPWPRAPGSSSVMRLPATKAVVIGVMVFALLVLAMLVWMLVEDRAQRARRRK